MPADGGTLAEPAPAPAAAAPPPDPAAAIHASNLVKTYPGRGRRGRSAEPVRALTGISFTVPTGTVFGLLGPNGAGKSTTVKILSTLSRPDSGEAWVAGFDVRREPEMVRRSIGLVTQKTGADLEATGRENLILQGRLFGLGGAALTRRVDELLERFDLTGAADRLARTYSGGMLRRLDVAIGLVHRPSVLFLDEPTTGLDPQARAAMWAEISALTADGLTILLTTHYLEEADRLAARIAIVEAGRIVVEGSPDELKSELRGDSVDLELAAAPDAATAAAIRERLLAVPDVGEVTVDGRSVHTRVAGGAATMPTIFAALDGLGVGVSAATLARPSLDDVYLRHVGHRMRPSDSDAALDAALDAGSEAGSDGGPAADSGGDLVPRQAAGQHGAGQEVRR